MYISDSNLKPDVINLIKTFTHPKTGILIDYNTYITKYYIVTFPIYSGQDDQEKLVEMIETINGKYNNNFTFNKSPLGFRIIPKEFYKKEYIVEYHIGATHSISHYLKPNIENGEITGGKCTVYMDVIYYKFPFIAETKITEHNFNKKIDTENFGGQEIIYCTPEIKQKLEE